MKTGLRFWNLVARIFATAYNVTQTWGATPCVNTIKPSFSSVLSLVSSAARGCGSTDMKLSRTSPGRSGYATD